MELTIESALSSDGALGHSAYLLLVLSMLMRRMVWLRLLVIASALLAIAYSALILTDPVSTFWESLLVLVNIGQLSLTWWLDRRTQFDAREDRLRGAHFPRLAPSRLRRLLRRGQWVALGAGTRLTCAGQPEVPERRARPAQKSLDHATTIKMGAVAAPGADDPVRPGYAVKDRGIVSGAHGVGGRAHPARIGIAPGEDVGHAKSPEPERPRPPLAAFDRGVVLGLGRGRGIEHDEQRLRPRRIPDTGQQIAVAFAGRIDRG